MVSAICPNCHILLVEATTNQLQRTSAAAVDEAAALGANAISNSYGGVGVQRRDAPTSRTTTTPGIAITVSSGDNGYGVEFPAASQYVTAVGGTLAHAATRAPRGWTETRLVRRRPRLLGATTPSRPGRPTAAARGARVADVSAVADPNTGVAVYDTLRLAGGWLVFGGTSASAPIIAARLRARRERRRASTYGSFPYAHTGAAVRRDGRHRTARAAPAYLCTAGPGYDGPTGLGTPNGTGGF